MSCRIVILFTLILLAGSAQAILPPDAKAREPQLRVYRQQMNDNYEKRLVERQAAAVQAYDQTRADIFTPPWLRGQSQTALPSGDSPESSGQTKPGKRNHRFLVSIMLLILIIAVTGWVRYVTRNVDE